MMAGPVPGPTALAPVSRPFRHGVCWSAKGDFEAVISRHLAAMQGALSQELEAVAAEREQHMQETLSSLQWELADIRKADLPAAAPAPATVQGRSPTKESIEKVVEKAEVSSSAPEEAARSDATKDDCRQNPSMSSVVPTTAPPESPSARKASVVFSLGEAAAAGGAAGAGGAGAGGGAGGVLLPGTAATNSASCGRSLAPDSRRESSAGPASRRASSANAMSALNSRRQSCDAMSKSRRSSVGNEHLFELWPAWKVEHNTFADRIVPVRPANCRSAQFLEEETTRKSFIVPTVIRCLQGAISPSSPFSCIWNIMFMSVLCYELIVLPLRVFQLPQGGLLWSLSLFAVLFWSADLVLSFWVGYYTKDGKLVMNRRLIVAKYARSWMLPDALIVCLDWVLLVSERADDVGSFPSLLRIGKALRYVRVLRVLRLLRLRKLRESLHLLDEFVSSEYFSISKNVFLNMIGILVISHFLGCIWFLVGTIRLPGWSSWVEVYNFTEKEWGYQYLTSLHWSLTQITPGSMEIQPQNIQERACAVIVLILGIIVFSSIVSSITSAVNNLKSIGARYDKQRWVMRRFFREQGVSKELMARVTRYSDNIIRPQQKRVATNEVDLLKMLPTSLYMDVMLELFLRDVEVHPLFTALHGQNKAVMQKICCALETMNTPKDDVLFIPGETASAMYFVIQGQFCYQMREAEQHQVDPREWFCEPVLWTPWVHQGSMEAQLDSELVLLESRKFQDVVSHHRSDMWLIKRYGAEFVRRMNELADDLATTSKDSVREEGDSVLGANSGLSDMLTIESAVDLLTSKANAFRNSVRGK